MKSFFSKNHFLGVVFNGESHGDIHFYSKRRRYTVLIANSSQAVCTPRNSYRSARAALTASVQRRALSVSHAASAASTAASSRSESTMSATVSQSMETRPSESVSLRSNLQRVRYSSVWAKSTPGKPLSRSLSSKRGSLGSHSLPAARAHHTHSRERQQHAGRRAPQVAGKRRQARTESQRF